MGDIQKKFGVKLFQLRNEADLTQAELAEKSNLSIDSISRIERGDRSPSFESLERIAAALGVKPVQMLNFEGEELELLAKCPSEVLDLWKLLRREKATQIKKIYEIAKILLAK